MVENRIKKYDSSHFSATLREWEARIKLNPNGTIDVHVDGNGAYDATMKMVEVYWMANYQLELLRVLNN